MRKSHEGETRTCNCCGRRYIYIRKSGHRLNTCNSCQVKKFRNKLKIKAVEYKGGKCEMCGYNKCMRSLSFHHKDQSEKDFTISEYTHLSFEWIKKELDKCQLLCFNCHMELHEELDRKKIKEY